MISREEIPSTRESLATICCSKLYGGTIQVAVPALSRGHLDFNVAGICHLGRIVKTPSTMEESHLF